jgi:hypothetical protein
VIKIRQLFLRPAARLLSALLETGVDANDCKCSRDQQLNVRSEAQYLYLTIFVFAMYLYLYKRNNICICNYSFVSQLKLIKIGSGVKTGRTNRENDFYILATATVVLYKSKILQFIKILQNMTFHFKFSYHKSINLITMRRVYITTVFTYLRFNVYQFTRIATYLKMLVGENSK